MRRNYAHFFMSKLFSFKRAGMGCVLSLLFSLICSSVFASPDTPSDVARDSIHVNSQLAGVYVVEGTTLYGIENITFAENKKATVKAVAVKKQYKPKELSVKKVTKKETKEDQKQTLCVCKPGKTPKDYLEFSGHNNKVTAPNKYEKAKSCLICDFQEIYFLHFEYTSLQNDISPATVNGENNFHHFTRPPPSAI